MAKKQIAQQQSPQPKTATPNQQRRQPAPAIQPSPQMKTSTLDRQRRKRAPLFTSKNDSSLLQLIGKRPLLVISGLGAGMLLAAGVAVIGLLTHPSDVEKVKHESAEPATKTENSTANSQTEEKSDLGLYGAVGLGCAAGSWIIIKRLQRRFRRRRRQLPKAHRSLRTSQKPQSGERSHRRVPASRKPGTSSPQKIAVGDSIVRRPNGQNLPRNSNKSTDLADRTDVRRRRY